MPATVNQPTRRAQRASMRLTGSFLVSAVAVLLTGMNAVPALAVTATSTIISASSALPSPGTPVTLTATVSGATSGPIGFCDLIITPHCLSSDLFAIKQLVGGKATVTVLPSYGVHEYRAVYTGTTSSMLSYSTSPVSVSVNGLFPTTTTLATSGQAVTATVTGEYSTTASLAGNVAFTDSGTSVGTAALGSTTFSTSFVPTTTSAAAAMAIPAGDLNNDGIADEIIYTGSTFYPVFGSSTGTMTLGTAFGSLTGVTRMMAYDFNSDGYADLVATTASGVQIYLGSSSATFSTGAFTSGASAWGMADFNYDGIPDIVGPADSTDTSIRVWLGTGTGSFTAVSSTTALSGTMTDLVTTDINGDSVLDVVAVGTASGGAPTAWAEVSTVLGTFTGGTATSLGGGTPIKVLAIDMNNDKIQDLAVTSSTGTVLALGVGNGQTSAINYPEGSGTFSVTGSTVGGGLIATGDLNSDGYADFVVGGGSTTATVVYGNGAGSVASTSTITLPATPTALQIADVNGDGLKDVVAAATSGITAETYTESSTATTPATNLVLTAGTHSITATYQGNGSYATSVSSPMTITTSKSTVELTVQNVGTTTTAGTAQLSASLMYTAGTTPTGAVTFSVNGAAAVTASCSVANSTTMLCGYTYPTTSLAAGTYTITASYAGDTNYAATTATGTLTVTAPKVLTVTVPAQTYDTTSSTTTLTATVGFPAGTPPTGASYFILNGSVINAACSFGSVSAATATSLTCTASVATAGLSGSYTLTFTMAADTNYSQTSGSGTLSQKTAPQPTVTITVPNVTAAVGTNANLSFNLSWPSADGLPGGTANPFIITVDGTISQNCTFTYTGFGTYNTANCSVSGFPTSSLAAGTHVITATVNGNGTYATTQATGTLTLQ